MSVLLFLKMTTRCAERNSHIILARTESNEFFPGLVGGTPPLLLLQLLLKLDELGHGDLFLLVQNLMHALDF